MLHCSGILISNPNYPQICKIYWSQDPYICFLGDLTSVKICYISLIWVRKCIRWIFREILIIIESCQNWKLPRLKVVKTERCPHWKLPKLKVAKIGNCQNWKLKLKVISVSYFCWHVAGGSRGGTKLNPEINFNPLSPHARLVRVHTRRYFVFEANVFSSIKAKENER